MKHIIDRWEHFKEIVGTEYALAELEKAMGAWLLSDHAGFILRMNDCDTLISIQGGENL